MRGRRILTREGLAPDAAHTPVFARLSNHGFAAATHKSTTNFQEVDGAAMYVGLWCEHLGIRFLLISGDEPEKASCVS